MAGSLGVSATTKAEDGGEVKSSILRRTAIKAAEKGLESIAKLVQLLPTATVLVFHILSPAFTNEGHCQKVNKIITAFLLGFCALSCYFDSFTDSFHGEDGKLYYGIATKTGLWIFFGTLNKTSPVDLSAYRLRFGDFVHAGLSVVVFGTVALMNTNVAHCFYPSLSYDKKSLVMALPGCVGFASSVVFLLFPSKRHGIGYPRSK
jgi:hypothetical protein